jgi:Lamin Tail Domain/Bacterial Ig domain/Secretion system C-terminal sorting domain
MKKIVFSLLFTCSMIAAAQAQIVISEIMFNPPESGQDSLEYIEFFNKSNTTVNLEGWTVFGATYTFPAGASLSAGSYLILSKSASAIQNVFGKASTQWDMSQALSNGGETLKILNAAGAVIDSVTYDDMAPWPLQAVGQGYSIVLCDPNADNSLATSWSAAVTNSGAVINNFQVFANPGAASGCITGLLAQLDLVAVVPGTPTTIDVLANDNLPNPVTALTVSTAPAHGTATVTADNKILYVPAAGYCGTDVLQYKVCDGPTSCSIASVNITIKCYPQRTIAQVSTENAQGQADSSGVSCELTGTVYGVNLRGSSNGSQFVIIDASGANGIATFRNLGTFGYTVTQGDRVTVRGTIAQFNGLTQINMDTIIKVASNDPLVTPEIVLKGSEATESRLVRISNLHLTNPAQWTTGVGTSGFTVNAVSDNNLADTIAIRIDNDVALYNELPPSANFDLICLGGQFDASAPFSSGYQMIPRFVTDVITDVRTTTPAFDPQATVWPNPTAEMLNIVCAEQPDRIELRDAQGKIIAIIAQPQTTAKIDLHNLPTGLYWLFLSKNGVWWQTQVVKK